MCDAFGAFFKKKTRRLQLLPSSFPSSLVSSAFLPPCLLPFIRVGSVRLARNGFDVWLLFFCGEGDLTRFALRMCSENALLQMQIARAAGASQGIRPRLQLGLPLLLKPFCVKRSHTAIADISADSALRRARGHLPRAATKQLWGRVQVVAVLDHSSWIVSKPLRRSQALFRHS